MFLFKNLNEQKCILSFMLFLFLIQIQHLIVDTQKIDTKCNKESIILDTKNGKVKGSCQSFSTTDDLNQTRQASVYSWLSIPYAQAPINDLRFKPPQTPQSWNEEILDGTRVSNSCMQFINKDVSDRFEFTNIWSISKTSTSQMSEDCLYLNVFLSADIYSSTTSSLNVKTAPIVIFFHGPDGEVGSGLNDIYNPSIFTALTSSIVVTINYRLGIFGFLHLKDGDEVIEGNQGFLDQYMALKWVQDNAARFNGDPSKITLMGHEAGSKFIGYHLMFKPSWSLFRNAILLSGSPVQLTQTALSNEVASQRAKLFLKEFLKCSTAGQLIECIKSINAFNLTMLSRSFFYKLMSNGNILTASNIKSPFLPVIDGKVFKESPFKAFRLGNFKKCNIIIGFNSQSGASAIPFNFVYVNDSKLLPKQTNKHNNSIPMRQISNFTQLADFLKKYYHFYPSWPHPNNEIILNSILSEYTRLSTRTVHNNENQLKSNYFHTLIKILTDETHACPSFKFLEYLTNASYNSNNKMYLFIYANRITSSKWPPWYGTVQGDELPMIFGMTLLNQQQNSVDRSVSYNPWLSSSNGKTYAAKDKQISKELMIRLANFIRDDDPNSKLVFMNKSWPVYKPSKSENEHENDNSHNLESLYLLIKSNGTIVNKITHDSCHLWNTLLPSHLDVFAEVKRNQSTNNSNKMKVKRFQFI